MNTAKESEAHILPSAGCTTNLKGELEGIGDGTKWDDRQCNSNVLQKSVWPTHRLHEGKYLIVIINKLVENRPVCTSNLFSTIFTKTNHRFHTNVESTHELRFFSFYFNIIIIAGYFHISEVVLSLEVPNQNSANIFFSPP